jgi:transposase
MTFTQADALLALVEPEALLADKGYDADHFVESLTARAIKVVIPPKSNRKVKRDCDFALYCERNIVERFFNTIKHFRAIATRYEKTAQNFLAGLHLVCALAWLKRRQALIGVALASFFTAGLCCRGFFC